MDKNWGYKITVHIYVKGIPNIKDVLEVCRDTDKLDGTQFVGADIELIKDEPKDI